jgi:hypothetical protein
MLLMNERIKDALKQVKLMAKQYGRDSKQYKDAVKHQAELVLRTFRS